MRAQNFTYGQDVPNYQSMAKKDFPLHNNTEALSNLQKQKLNGLELRKSHFHLGHDPASFNQARALPSQSLGMPKSNNLPPQIPKPTIPLAKQTNLQISHTNPVASSDLFQYETVTGTQMAAIKSDKNN